MQTTPLIQIEKNVFAKLENALPTNSHKFRLAKAFFKDAISKKFSKIAVGTCGNYGRAIEYLSKVYGFNCKIFIPETYAMSSRQYSESSKSQIIVAGKTYEETVQISEQWCIQNPSYYDANCKAKNDYILKKAYKSLGYEIKNYFKNKIENLCIWLPIGNGTTFVSLYEYFRHYEFCPMFGVIGSLNNSSPIKSMLELKSVAIQANKKYHTIYNEPLINYEPVYNTNHLIEISKNNIIKEVSDNDLLEASKYLLSKNIKASTYGCASLAGFNYHRLNTNKLHNKKHVIIITG
jgi:threonine synthase